MHFVSPRRSGEWTPAKAVTFIVTLAASRSVTLAAHEADRAFAEAWNAALKAREANRPKARAKGDKSDSSDNPRSSRPQADSARASAAWIPLMDDEHGALRETESARRDSFFASLARSLVSAPLAARHSRQ